MAGKDVTALKAYVRQHLGHIVEDVDYREITKDTPVYHISTNPRIQEFVPMVSTRTMKKEDRTVARICTAPHLWGCIAGYESVLFDSTERTKGKDFTGEYTIYRVPARAVLLPNRKLVPDAETTKEEWVVAMDKYHAAISPDVVGKFYVDKIITSNHGQLRESNIVAYLRADEDLVLGPDLVVEKGYHRFYFTHVSQHVKPGVSAEAVAASDYREHKKPVVALETLKQVPKSSSW